MLTTSAGPDGVARIGDIVELGKKEAAALVRGGFAEEVADAPPSEAALERSAETAEGGPPETAAA